MSCKKHRYTGLSLPRVLDCPKCWDAFFRENPKAAEVVRKLFNGRAVA